MTASPAEDRRWMRRALALARRGWGRTAPNPMVGAVLVRDGAVVGAGWHAEFGGAHAEGMALAAAGASARGATCYVTLEPCAHQGKTPPCAPALVDAGVARVVIGVADPNPVAAGGAAVLRAAGIPVTVGVEATAAEALVAPFLHAARGATRPFVTLKLAVSADGAIAPADGAPRWLTGPLARRLVHRLRAQVDAVAVGIGTVLTDDPRLTVRDVAPPRVAPRRVVFDHMARLPLASRLVRTAREVPVTVLVAPGAPAARIAALEAAGVEVIPGATPGASLGILRDRGVRHLLVEGGAGVAAGLLDAGLVDRVVILQASGELGPGALPALGHAGRPLAERAAGWPVLERRRLGPDVLTVYAPPAR